MNTLDDVVRTAKPCQPEARARLDGERFLPVESRAKSRLSALLGAGASTALGDPALDKEYRRLDVPAALASSRRQKGVPFPVPRFALFATDGDGSCEAAASARRFKASSGGPGWDRKMTENGVDPRPFGGRVNDPVLAEQDRKRASIFAPVAMERLSARASSLAIRSALGPMTFMGAIMIPVSAWAWYSFGCLEMQSLWQCLVSGILAFFGVILSISAIMGALDGGIEGSGQVAISCQFDGVIPDGVRKRIKDFRSGHFFDQTYLLCEVGQWAYKEDSAFRFATDEMDKDPLVVAKYKDAWYLVDKFDVTPVEEWAARELSS